MLSASLNFKNFNSINNNRSVVFTKYNIMLNYEKSQEKFFNIFGLEIPKPKLHEVFAGVASGLVVTPFLIIMLTKTPFTIKEVAFLFSLN